MLTGLPNRTALLNRMTEHLDAPAASTQAQRSRVALILLDLDRFKVVNESLEARRRRPAAGRGRAPARVDRPLDDVVARLGSDEFGVLLGPVRSVREAERVAAGSPPPSRCRSTSTARGHRRRQPRPGGRPGVDDVRRRPAQGGGDRPPSGQARPGPQVRHVRPEMRAETGPGDPRARPPPRHRALRAARPLPAAGRPRHRHGRGPRGAAPLAAPDPRPRAPCRSSRSPRRPA